MHLEEGKAAKGVSRKTLAICIIKALAEDVLCVRCRGAGKGLERIQGTHKAPTRAG